MEFSTSEHCAARRTFETINGSHRAPIMMDFRDLRARKNVLMTLLHECAKNSAKNACQSGKEMVFCFQNCSDLLWEKSVVVIEKNFWNSSLKTKNLQKFWDHLNNLFKQWIGPNNFWNRKFLTCSWRLIRSNELENLEFKLEKFAGI